MNWYVSSADKRNCPALSRRAGYCSNVVYRWEHSSHSCALKQDGALRCWGSGTSGKLGHGDGWKITPQRVNASHYRSPVPSTLRPLLPSRTAPGRRTFPRGSRPPCRSGSSTQRGFPLVVAVHAAHEQSATQAASNGTVCVTRRATSMRIAAGQMSASNSGGVPASLVCACVCLPDLVLPSCLRNPTPRAHLRFVFATTNGVRADF